MLYVFESVQYRSWRKLCLRACAFLILRTRTGTHRYTTAAILRRKCILELANDVSSGDSEVAHDQETSSQLSSGG